MDLTERMTCRVCGSGSLAPILSLGDQYVSDFVDVNEGFRLSLNLVLCEVRAGGCGLLQLQHTVPRELLYKQYWYRSGINATMRRALAEIAARAEQTARPAPGDIVLDIGCNDGTLLRSYTADVRRVGFEPARNLVAEAQVGTTLVLNEFFASTPFLDALGGARAKVVTSVAMFYDLEDPNTFVADVARCLDDDGVWIIQMSYLPSMLEQNAFDNICHEHLEYYSLLPLRALLDRHALEVFDVELNDVNGGSFQVCVRHARRGATRAPSPRVAALEAQERGLHLHERDVYDRFARRVEELRDSTYELVSREVARGKSLYAYGASTKGNTLLQYYGLDHRLVTAAADRNPEKWGKKTIGTLIPIVSEDEARSAKPDYFLVLPWAFLPEFRERERAFLAGGGRFIVPLPTLALVGAR